MTATWFLVWARALARQYRSVLPSLAVLFMLGPLMAGTSLAVEYGRALKVRSELQIAADAAVRAAATHPGGDEAAVAARLRSVLDGHLRRSLQGVPFTFSVTEAAVAIHIDARVANALAGFIGKPRFHFEVTSEAPLEATAALAGSPRREQEPAGSASGEAASPDDAEVLLERSMSAPPGLGLVR